ncbi:hypothetical protein BC940DRAFT_297555 [Gongronella butleri]|nr:hypothetical protein BC940DRAFT_297555 [Gongronella butleri]
MNEKHDSDHVDVLNNLMNYSMPGSLTSLDLLDDMTPVPKRMIQQGDLQTQLRKLEADMEQLTLSNVRLLRANRILKLESDKLVDDQTRQLKKDIQDLRRMNIELQRNNRLLQDDLTIRNAELNSLRDDPIRQMRSVGPEYEYLVQMIHLLYRQIDGKSNCVKTCCYTNLPLSQGFSVLTLPPEDQEQRPQAQHICRPVIHSNPATTLQHENHKMQEKVAMLESDKDDLQQLVKEKDEVIQVLKNELMMKDLIVTQLEKDFEKMEVQALALLSDHSFPLPPSSDSTSDSSSPVSEFFPTI